MVDYSDIQSELNTQWNAGVIAKPTFKNGNQSDTSKYPKVLFISLDNTNGLALQHTSITNTSDKAITNFFITIVAANRTNLEKFISETRRIINAKRLATVSGWWQVSGQPQIYNTLKRYKATLLCEEIKMIAASGWE